MVIWKEIDGKMLDTKLKQRNLVELVILSFNSVCTRNSATRGVS